MIQLLIYGLSKCYLITNYKKSFWLNIPNFAGKYFEELKVVLFVAQYIIFLTK